MRILVVTPEYLPTHGGGIITFYRDLLPEFVRAGHDVTVLVGSGAFTVLNPSPLSLDGVQVLQLDDARFRANLIEFEQYRALPVLRALLAAAWSLHQMAAKLGPFDVVELADWGLLYLPWVIGKSVPNIVQMHGSSGQIDTYDPVAGEEAQGVLVRLLESAGLQHAGSVQAYSEQNAKFWTKQTSRPVEAIRPAWRGPDIPGDQEMRSMRGLVVGRVQQWKGPQVLCAALETLGESAPYVDWVGRDTPFGSRSESMADFLASHFPNTWNKRVLHSPPMPPEQIAQRLARAAFAVVPSLWDTLNFTCVESMGAGTPTICSDGAGASELIEDGVNGFVFEAGNPESLASAILQFQAMDESARRTMGEAGRETVRRELDPPSIAAQRLVAYEQAIACHEANPLPEDHWLRLACSPSSERLPAPMAFLDHLPLSDILRYSLRRTVGKIFR